MSRTIQHAEIQGFITESRSTLPILRDLLGAYQRDPSARDALLDAHRFIKNLRGASAMIGQRSLSRITGELEQWVGEVRDGSRPYDQRTAEQITKTLDDIDLALSSFTLLASRVRGMADRQDRDDDEEIEEIFRLEAEDHLGELTRLLIELEARPEDRALRRELQRRAHSLKGGAGTAGFPEISRLAHRMEDLLDAILEDSIPWSPEVPSLLLRTTETLQALLQRGADSSRSVRVDELMGPYAELLQEPEPRLEARTHPASSDAAPRNATPTAPSPNPVLRIPAERHDQLMHLVGELTINRGTLELQVQNLGKEVDESEGVRKRLDRIAGWLEDITESESSLPERATATRETDTSEEMELDRYTETDIMSRALTEAAADLSTVTADLRSILRSLESAVDREKSLSRGLEGRLLASRMVRFATLVPRLQRAARVAAAGQDKLVELVVRGQEVELDKMVLERLSDPLLHMIRNAVGHGIEPRTGRRGAGKPEQGRIEIELSQQGRRTTLRIRDDGSGLDTAAIRAAVLRLGAFEKEELDRMSDREIRRLIFLPGLSTAEQVDEISGRGVGMDVVETTLRELKGRVEVSSEPGSHTAFTLRLPMSLTTDRVLLVDIGGQIYAIPQALVARILTLPPEELDFEGPEPNIEIDGQPLPAIHLGEPLGLGVPAVSDVAAWTVLIIDDGEATVAAIVDNLAGARDVVVKPLASHLAHVPGVSGATLLGDGSIVLILQPVELTQLGDTPARHAPSLTVPRRSLSEVLVVDDSLSVRRSVTRTVEDAGWRALTARDGQEALEMLQQGTARPSAILLDIEMPRMDGYELASTLRGLEDLSRIPIVMLTSRGGEAYRRRALELGVRELLVKPYREEVLLSTLRAVMSAA